MGRLMSVDTHEQLDFSPQTRSVLGDKTDYDQLNDVTLKPSAATRLAAAECGDHAQRIRVPGAQRGWETVF